MKNINRVLALLLALTLFLGLVPAMAAEESASNGLFGVLDLNVTAYEGGWDDNGDGVPESKYQGASYNTSFWATWMQDTNDNIIPSRTAYGLRIRTSFTPSLPEGKSLKILVQKTQTNATQVEIEEGEDTIPKLNEKLGKGEEKIEVIDDSEVYYYLAPQNGGSGHTIYYIFGVVVDDAKGYILDSTVLSVDCGYSHQRSNRIHYFRTGLQARVLNGNIVMGPYTYNSYINSFQTNKARIANEWGIYQDVTDTYTGMDGKKWPSAYFDVEYGSTNATKGIENLTDIQNHINQTLHDWAADPEKPIVRIGSNITVAGPAYVEAVNDYTGVSKTYNMEYYTLADASGSDGILSFASWGENSRTKDFLSYGLQTAIIPVLPSGSVKIRCWDEDDRSKEPLHTDLIQVGDFLRMSDGSEFYMAAASVVQAYNNAISQANMESFSRYLQAASKADPATTSAIMQIAKEQSVSTLTERVSLGKEIKASGSNYGLDEEGNPIPISNETTEKIAETVSVRENTIDKLSGYSALAPFVTKVDIQAPALDGYNFDFGYAYDTISDIALNTSGMKDSAYTGYGGMALSGTVSTGSILVSTLTDNVVVDLYYKAKPEELTSYTVKVRINGTIDETYTKTAAIQPGAVIFPSKFDAESYIPEGAIVKNMSFLRNGVEWGFNYDEDVTNYDLVMLKDHTQNVIIIDCEYNAYYIVKVRFDGEVREEYTRTYPVVPGTVVEIGDVFIPVIPEEWGIVDVGPVPVTVLSGTPPIIYIDCTIDPEEYPVTYMYYCNGTLVDTIQSEETYRAGTVIEGAPLRDYSGYVYDHTDGTPLTVSGPGGTIRVYYISKVVSSPDLAVNATLYKDKNYSVVITKEKSGYGVYGIFRVDVSDYIGKTQTVTWSEPDKSACTSVAKSATKALYGNVNVTAKASYREGLPITDANKNGTEVSVSMVLDHKSDDGKYWYFRFPINTRNKTGLAKAYIPINWKDGTDWTVNFTATVTYDRYDYWNEDASCKCNGHTPPARPSSGGGRTYRSLFSYAGPIQRIGLAADGKTYHTINYKLLKGPSTVHCTATRTGKASIRVNGSMYEDDFSGGNR